MERLNNNNNIIMTRRIILAAALVVSVLSANAQEKESKWSITPRVGVEISDFANDKMEIYTPRGGYAIGVEAERRISKLLGLSTGVYYTKQEVGETTQVLLSEDNNLFVNVMYAVGKHPDNLRDHIDETNLIELQHYTGMRHEIQQINVPLLLNFHVWKGLTLKTGVEYAYLHKAKLTRDVYEYWYETDPKIHYEPDEIPLANSVIVPPVQIVGPKSEKSYKRSGSIGEKYHRNNISIPIGVSYCYKNIELDARYLFGVTKLLPNDTFGNHLRTSTFQITLGYRIGL